MRHDLLSDVLSSISNGDNFGKKEAVTPASKLVRNVLILMQKHGYIGNFEYIDDGKGGKFRIMLLGQVNKCGSVRPRFSVAADEYEKWEKRYLPASEIGLLIVSTPKGVMTHEEAKNNKTGGKLLAYVY